jgi:hypothetical protein
MAGCALKLESFHCFASQIAGGFRVAPGAKWPAHDACESVLHFRIGKAGISWNEPRKCGGKMRPSGGNLVAHATSTYSISVPWAADRKL